MKLRAEKVTQVDGILDISQEHWLWKLRVLTLEKDNVKKSPALEALADWSQNQEPDFKKIKKVIQLVGQTHRVQNEKQKAEEAKNEKTSKRK